MAEEPFELVVRPAEMVLYTPWAPVTVAVKRFSSRRTCSASTPAEAHSKTRPSVILAARNHALLDWLTDDQRFLTATYAVTLAVKGSRHETGGQPGCGGAWLAAVSHGRAWRATSHSCGACSNACGHTASNMAAIRKATTTRATILATDPHPSAR
jgi:hypothetical protein